MYSMFGFEITAKSDLLAAQLNVELVNQPIHVVKDLNNVLHIKIRDTEYLNLKSHPVNPSEKLINLVDQLKPTNCKVQWNNTGSCFWLSIV